MGLSAGDQIKLKIDRVSNSGNPIAEFGGQHIIVEDAPPEEVVLAEITSTEEVLTAKLVNVLETGPETELPPRQKKVVDAYRRKQQRKVEHMLDQIGNSENTAESESNQLPDVEANFQIEDEQQDQSVTVEEDETEDRNMNDELSGGVR